MTRASSTMSAVGVLADFSLATVWLPDFVLRLGPVASASALIRDGLVLVVWGVALAAGICGLDRRGIHGVAPDISPASFAMDER